MRFDELTERNFLLFAIKHYENPQAVTKEDFDKDLNHFRYIKRLLKRYRSSNELKLHLLINHFIILYNTFVVFLDRLPEYPRTYIHEIECDHEIQQQLERMTNGEIKN